MYSCKCGEINYPIKKRGKNYCKQCNSPVYEAVCPTADCRNKLPPMYDSVNVNKIIAIVGPKAVGKSIFITVLIKQIEEQMASEFGISFRPADQHTIDHYKEYVNHIYRDKEILDATSEGKPLIYYLEKKKK